MNSIKTNFRWLIVSILFAILFINYLDRASIGYAIDNITKEFHLSDWQIGLVLGAFGVGYLVTSFLGGLLADRFGAKRTFAVSILLWGIGSFFTSIATDFFLLFGARVILGLAEGPSFPSMTRAISDWLSAKEYNRALSLAILAVPVSLAFGGPIISQLISMFGWRGSYYFLTIVSLVWIPLWWWVFQDKPEDSRYVTQAELTYLKEEGVIQPIKSREKMHWKSVLCNKTLLANNWAFFVFGYYLFFFITWLPRYLNQLYHLDIKQIGFYSMAPWLLAAILMWGVGSLADFIYKKTKSLRLSRSYPILISQLISAICIIPIVLVSDVFWAMFFITLAVGFAMSANASYYTVNIDVVKERVGSALGIMIAVFAISGFLAPTLTGALVSWTGHFEAAFFLLAALGLSSTLITLIFHNRAPIVGEG